MTTSFSTNGVLITYRIKLNLLLFLFLTFFGKSYSAEASESYKNRFMHGAVSEISPRRYFNAACDSVYPLKKKVRTIITGEAKMLKSDVIKVRIHDFSNYYDREQSEFSPKLTLPLTDKKFKLEIDITHPVYIGFDYPGAGALNSGDLFQNTILTTKFISSGMLIEPGDSINVEVEQFYFFNYLKLSGIGVEKLWCIQDIIRNTNSYKFPATLDIYTRKDFSDTIRSMLENTIEKYGDKITCSAAYIIKAHYLPMLGGDIADIVIDSRKNIHDPDIITFYKNNLDLYGIDPGDPNTIYAAGVSTVLTKRALLDYAMHTGRAYSDGYDNEYYYAIKQYLPDSKVREKLLADRLKLILGRTGLNTKAKDAVKDFLQSTNESSSFYKGVESNVKKFQGRLSKGAPAFPFILADTSGKKVRMSDFAGKVVLLDFMFNPCGGCMALVPYLESIEQAYKNSPDLEFVSISIDLNKDTWKKGIGIYSLSSSVQLNTPGPDSPICKFYNVWACPQLVLIDKKGNIITSAAPDPRRDNGKALKALIDKSLLSN